MDTDDSMVTAWGGAGEGERGINGCGRGKYSGNCVMSRIGSSLFILNFYLMEVFGINTCKFVNIECIMNNAV